MEQNEVRDVLTPPMSRAYINYIDAELVVCKYCRRPEPICFPCSPCFGVNAAELD